MTVTRRSFVRGGSIATLGLISGVSLRANPVASAGGRQLSVGYMPFERPSRRSEIGPSEVLVMADGRFGNRDVRLRVEGVAGKGAAAGMLLLASYRLRPGSEGSVIPFGAWRFGPLEGSASSPIEFGMPFDNLDALELELIPDEAIPEYERWVVEASSRPLLPDWVSSAGSLPLRFTTGRHAEALPIREGRYFVVVQPEGDPAPAWYSFAYERLDPTYDRSVLVTETVAGAQPVELDYVILEITLGDGEIDRNRGLKARTRGPN